jgi:hypothetical protein
LPRYTATLKPGCIPGYLPSGPTDTEPASITELQAIRRDAAEVLGNVKSERDCYGHHRKDVPHDSYEFCKKKTDDILSHYVGPAEEAYRVYASAAETQAVKNEVIRQGLSRAQLAMDEINALIEELVWEREQTIRTIQVCTGAMESAHRELRSAVKMAENEI